MTLHRAVRRFLLRRRAKRIAVERRYQEISEMVDQIKADGPVWRQRADD